MCRHRHLSVDAGKETRGGDGSAIAFRARAPVVSSSLLSLSHSFLLSFFILLSPLSFSYSVYGRITLCVVHMIYFLRTRWKLKKGFAAVWTRACQHNGIRTRTLVFRKSLACPSAFSSARTMGEIREEESEYTRALNTVYYIPAS